MAATTSDSKSTKTDDPPTLRELVTARHAERAAFVVADATATDDLLEQRDGLTRAVLTMNDLPPHYRLYLERIELAFSAVADERLLEQWAREYDAAHGGQPTDSTRPTGRRFVRLAPKEPRRAI